MTGVTTNNLIDLRLLKHKGQHQDDRFLAVSSG